MLLDAIRDVCADWLRAHQPHVWECVILSSDRPTRTVEVVVNGVIQRAVWDTAAMPPVGSRAIIVQDSAGTLWGYNGSQDLPVHCEAGWIDAVARDGTVEIIDADKHIITRSAYYTSSTHPGVGTAVVLFADAAGNRWACPCSGIPDPRDTLDQIPQI